MANGGPTAYLPEDGSHWYDGHGAPVYRVPRADGKGLRDTTLRDARKLGLFPSVTVITRMLARPALQAWIVNQHVMAALTLPEAIGEAADDRARRVLRDASAQARKASEFGGRIHAAIEMTLKGQDPLDSDLFAVSDVPYVQAAQAWLKLHPMRVVETEFSFTNEEHGFGGRLDCIAEVEPYGICVVDWKTQQTVTFRNPKTGIMEARPFRHYPENGIQLGAYANGIGHPEYSGLNVYLSSTEPWRSDTHVWLPSETWRWEAFLALKGLWYSPAGPGWKLNPAYLDVPGDDEEEV